MRRWLSRLPRGRAPHDLDEALVARLATRRIPGWKQLRLLPRVLSVRERIISAVLLVLFLGSASLLVVRAAGRFTAPVPVVGGSYTEGIIGSPQYLNPLFTANNDADDDLVQLLFSGLVRSNRDHEIEPALAESFTLNPEGTQLTVTLRPDLRWSDGAPLTADDVLFTYGMIQDTRFKSPLNGTFKNVTIERVDDRTVRFTRKQALATFAAALTVGLLPEHLWQEVPPTNIRLHKLNVEPVGAGPYRVKEFRVDSAGAIKQYVLEPNSHYWGDPARIATLTLKFFPDTPSAIDALRGNTVEGLSVVDGSGGADREVLDSGSVRVQTLRLPRTTALFFNDKRANLKTNELREALVVALDRHAIADAVTGSRGNVSDGPLPVGFPGSAAPTLVHAYDPAKAAELLENAGWKKGDDGLRRKDGKEGAELKLTITTSDREEYIEAAELVEKAWEAIGLVVEVNLVAANRITRDVIKPRDYEVILFSQVLGPDLDPFPFWHSSQETDPGLNLASFFRRESDKLLEEARSATSTEVRHQKLAAFQEQLLIANPAAFLYQGQYLYPLGKKVKGFDLRAVLAPADRFADVSAWYVQSRRQVR